MTASSRDRLEHALARIADPAGEGARTCLTVYAEAARKAADDADARAGSGASRGPLDGAIVTIKDLFDVAGEVTRAGSRVLAARGRPAATDAPAVARLRAAGAVIVAKTNMTEFAYSGIGANPHFGTPGNPADRARVPGGSSSGAAVSVADGMCEIAIGTDTGGSTRIPAAFCGTVGFKPTASRVPREGAVPLSTTLDSVGPLAHRVADCARADAVLAGEAAPPFAPRPLGSVRAGFVQGYPAKGLDAVVGKAFPAALQKLAPHWKAAADVTVDALDIMHAVNDRGGIAPPEAYSIHRGLLDGEGIDPNVRARLDRGASISAADYIAKRLDALADEVERGWSGRFIEGEGYVFERTVRGVKDVAVIDAALLSSAEARKLDEYAARLQEAYPRSAILRRKDSETPIHGPVSLFEAVIEAGRKGVTYQRYKGLGEMNPDQLWETTLDVNARSLLQVKIREVDAADDIFTKLMGDVVEPRREFIQDNALDAAVDA